MVIHAGLSSELAPLLVPFVEVSVSHDEGVYLLDGFGPSLGRDELVFEVGLELCLLRSSGLKVRRAQMTFAMSRVAEVFGVSKD